MSFELRLKLRLSTLDIEQQSRKDNRKLTSNGLYLLQHLADLRLNSSSLVCDCHLRWLLTWALDTGLSRDMKASCRVPRELSGRLFTSLTPDDISCGKYTVKRSLCFELRLTNIQGTASEIATLTRVVTSFHCTRYKSLVPKSVNSSFLFLESGVTFRPKMVAHPSSVITGIVGKAVSLACTFRTSYADDLKVLWRKGHEELLDVGQMDLQERVIADNSSLEITSHLHLRNLTMSHAGLYQCVARNEFGAVYSEKGNLTIYGTFWNCSVYFVIYIPH